MVDRTTDPGQLEQPATSIERPHANETDPIRVRIYETATVTLSEATITQGRVARRWFDSERNVTSVSRPPRFIIDGTKPTGTPHTPTGMMPLTRKPSERLRPGAVPRVAGDLGAVARDAMI